MQVEDFIFIRLYVCRIERLHSFQNNRKTRQSSLETPSRRNQLPVADWQKALDDLQSVGESSQYLTDLEVSA